MCFLHFITYIFIILDIFSPLFHQRLNLDNISTISRLPEPIMTRVFDLWFLQFVAAEYALLRFSMESSTCLKTVSIISLKKNCYYEKAPHIWKWNVSIIRHVPINCSTYLYNICICTYVIYIIYVICSCVCGSVLFRYYKIN